MAGTSEHPLSDPAPEPALGESRSRVLDLLREADAPLGVQEIAARTGLHSNTARFHLDGLVSSGLADRSSEDRGTPGRPRTVYRVSAAEDAAGQRSYRLLAGMLTSLVTEALPRPAVAAVAAVAAGETWGRFLAERPGPLERVDAQDAVRRLSKVLADAGFAPGPVQGKGGEGGEGQVIPLRHCPFVEIADQHRDVVCSLHLGLMRGVLDEVRAPVGVDRLDPFVEPSLCLAHLGAPDDRKSA